MRIHIIAKSADAINIQSVYINVTAVSVEEINIQSVNIYRGGGSSTLGGA